LKYDNNILIFQDNSCHREDFEYIFIRYMTYYVSVFPLLLPVCWKIFHYYTVVTFLEDSKPYYIRVVEYEMGVCLELYLMLSVLIL
jgi:hypothetical protein